MPRRRTCDLSAVAGLPGVPFEIAAPSGVGPILVRCGADRPSVNWLTAVGLDGRVLWKRPVENWSGQLRIADDGGIWLRGVALHEILPDGSDGRQVELAAEPGERLGDFVILAAGFLLAWTTEPFSSARIERVDDDGARVWSTPLPVPTLSHVGVAQGFGPERWEAVLVSGDRVLATYCAWSSGLGVSFCLDLASGRLAWTTPPRPNGDRAITGPGTFLVGECGYGAFASRHHGRDGGLLAEWPSAGRALTSQRGRIRVVESTNDNSRPQRLRRLHRNATMTDGPTLTGYYTVGPALSRAGAAVFWRDGTLQAAGPDLAVRTLAREPGWNGVDRMLLFDTGLLAFVLDRDHPTGADRRLVLVPTDLGPLDDGPWSCGEGNLRANPVYSQSCP